MERRMLALATVPRDQTMQLEFELFYGGTVTGRFPRPPSFSSPPRIVAKVK
jgi:hypothetical protein